MRGDTVCHFLLYAVNKSEGSLVKIGSSEPGDEEGDHVSADVTFDLETPSGELLGAHLLLPHDQVRFHLILDTTSMLINVGFIIIYR